MKSEAVFFDLETSGLTTDHQIIQLAAVAVDLSTWTELEVYERKLKFDVGKADPGALRLNSYDEGVWKAEAVDERTAILGFKALLERHRTVTLISRAGKPYVVARLGGHNVVGFDLPRLIEAFKRHGEFLPAALAGVLDTQQGAAWYFCRTPPEGYEVRSWPVNLKLQTLAECFGIETAGAHDALVDVRTTVRIAKALLR